MRLEVFVALVAVVVAIVVLLVPLHVLHGAEVEVAICERALDSIRVRESRHLGLCCPVSVIRLVARTNEPNAHLLCEGGTLGGLVVL